MSSAGKNYITIVLLAVVFFFNCKDDVLQSETSANIRQVGKCNNLGLNKSAGECFEYTYADNLLIKFCVSGNCCPDSARFVSSYKITDNVITITVKDTAPNLCKCICNYTIQADFSNVFLESYMVACLQETEQGLTQLYSEPVYKTR